MMKRKLTHKPERLYELSLEKATSISGKITSKRVLRNEWLTRQIRGRMPFLPVLPSKLLGLWAFQGLYCD